MGLAFSNFYAWFAILSGIATVATFVTGILFFAVSDKFGKINDIASVFQVLLMLPLMVLFVMLVPAGMKVWAVIAGLIGAAGMLRSAYGQSMLVFDRIDFERSRDFFPSGAAIGLWLVVIGVLSILSSLLPPVLAWIGIVAGLGYILTVVGFLRGGESDPVFYTGAGLLGLGYPVWAICLGVLLLG